MRLSSGEDHPLVPLNCVLVTFSLGKLLTFSLSRNSDFGLRGRISSWVFYQK
jgi:hypothetical protein